MDNRYKHKFNIDYIKTWSNGKSTLLEYKIKKEYFNVFISKIHFIHICKNLKINILNQNKCFFHRTGTNGCGKYSLSLPLVQYIRCADV